MTPLLQIENASFGYRNQQILSEITLNLNSSEFVVLEGRNGCGKSTLIKAITKQTTPLAGVVQWNIHASEIGYVPQELSLDPAVPATANDIVLSSFLKKRQNLQEFCDIAFDRVGLKDMAHLRFGSLSGGQKRRVLIARAIVHQPKALILDEPTVNIDAETEKSLSNLLHEMAYREGIGILTTTHADSWVQQARRLHIRGGKIHE